MVAPLVGAWIEMTAQDRSRNITNVAPLVGARIEIKGCPVNRREQWSLPLWERGLK